MASPRTMAVIPAARINVILPVQLAPSGLCFANSCFVAKTAQILVADDDEGSVRFLRWLLVREGHRVSVVSTVEEALTACESDAPDLVLVDLVAPRGHGFDLCRRLKNQSFTRFIPVVIVTAQ